jgi:hypothetical protein
MARQVVIDGVRLFAHKQGFKLEQPDELMFVATVPGEQYPIFIGIELFGLMVSFAIPCGALPSPSLAPTLLRNNWGGVEATCFFFSVNIDDGKAWLNLETRQFIGADPTPERIAEILGRCWMFAQQAKESLRK